MLTEGKYLLLIRSTILRRVTGTLSLRRDYNTTTIVECQVLKQKTLFRGDAAHIRVSITAVATVRAYAHDATVLSYRTMLHRSSRNEAQHKSVCYAVVATGLTVMCAGTKIA